MCWVSSTPGCSCWTGPATTPRPLRELLQSAYFVPDTLNAATLLRDMQSRKVHIAVVIDEYGDTAGIVTMEDLLEEIVGNIYDEFDPSEPEEIEEVSPGVWRVSGGADIEEVAEALDVDLPEDLEFDTLGGLVFSQLHTIPQDGPVPDVEACGSTSTWIRWTGSASSAPRSASARPRSPRSRRRKTGRPLSTLC